MSKHLINFFLFLFFIKSFKEQNAKETNFVDFEKISSEISEISDTISNLREKVLKTNMSIQVELDGKSVTLSRLKLMIDDIRSELAQIDGINEKDIFSSRRRRNILSLEDQFQTALKDGDKLLMTPFIPGG